jgi:hypothetical protein
MSRFHPLSSASPTGQTTARGRAEVGISPWLSHQCRQAALPVLRRRTLRRSKGETAEHAELYLRATSAMAINCVGAGRLNINPQSTLGAAYQAFSKKRTTRRLRTPTLGSFVEA